MACVLLAVVVDEDSEDIGEEVSGDESDEYPWPGVDSLGSGRAVCSSTPRTGKVERSLTAGWHNEASTALSSLSKLELVSISESRWHSADQRSEAVG
jgi:hypothetical protein